MRWRFGEEVLQFRHNALQHSEFSVFPQACGLGFAAAFFDGHQLVEFIEDENDLALTAMLWPAEPSKVVN